jgi:hypothetical protein
LYDPEWVTIRVADDKPACETNVPISERDTSRGHEAARRRAKRSMEAHFKVCAHCTAVLEGTQNVVKLVGDGVGFDLPEGFSRRLYNKIKER